MKKMLILFTIICLTGPFFLFAGGGGQQSGAANKEVNFWYLWGGEEGAYIEQIIAAYNKSQDKYHAVGLSVPDQAKVITAISGGTGPDTTDDFNTSAPLYAAEQIAEPLDAFIAKDNLDISKFNKSAYELVKYNGKVYMLPLSINVSVLYYNKDILAKAGITAPPKTLEELQKMERDLTIVQNGEITQLGGNFIGGDYVWAYTYANGTNFGTVGNLTPNNAGFRKVLDYIASMVSAFGSNAFNNFITSGEANIYSPQDPFLAGKQAFRSDGAWLFNMAKDAGVNFDIMPIPASSSVGGSVSTLMGLSTMYVPTTAKNKDGGWDFTKYITYGEGAKMFITLKGDVPALTALTTDRDVVNIAPHFRTYLDIVSGNSMIGLPLYTGSQEYTKAISDAAEAVRLGTPIDRAIADMEATVARIGR